MQRLFYGCSSISLLPDISIWKVPYYINIEGIFYGCSSISILPDISKWEVSKYNTKYFIDECLSLSKVPDISEWSYFNRMQFEGCISLLNPDILEYKYKFIYSERCFIS